MSITGREGPGEREVGVATARRAVGVDSAREAGEILDRMIGEDADLRRLVDEKALHLHIGEMIHRARSAAGLTQAELAKLVGRTQSVISRLEDADYRGHSLAMLLRIAQVLDLGLEVRFQPDVA